MSQEYEMMRRAIEQKQMQMVMAQTAPLEQVEGGKWELDTTPYLDKIYHELLGESLDPKTGIYNRDPRKRRMMNELGATEYISQLNLASIHMQFSDLTEEKIEEIASYTAEHYAEMIVDFLDEWEIIKTASNYRCIADRLYFHMYVLLAIARSGGMKRHREKAKNPYANIPQQPEQVV